MLNIKEKNKAGKRDRSCVAWRRVGKLYLGRPRKASPRVTEGNISVETRKEEGSQLWGCLGEELSRRTMLQSTDCHPGRPSVP